MAPGAAERAALEEDGRPDAGAVVERAPLHVEDRSRRPVSQDRARHPGSSRRHRRMGSAGPSCTIPAEWPWLPHNDPAGAAPRSFLTRSKRPSAPPASPSASSTTSPTSSSSRRTRRALPRRERDPRAAARTKDEGGHPRSHRARSLSAPLGERYLEQDLAVCRTGKPIEDLLELHLYPDGHEGWCVTTKVPLRGDAGDLLGVVGTSRDVRPPDPGSGSLAGLAEAVRIVHEHPGRPHRVEELARRAGLSPDRFSRRVRAVFGLSASQLVIKVRIDAARRMLREIGGPDRTDRPRLRLLRPERLHAAVQGSGGADPRPVPRRCPLTTLQCRVILLPDGPDERPRPDRGDPRPDREGRGLPRVPADSGRRRRSDRAAGRMASASRPARRRRRHGRSSGTGCRWPR